MRYLLENLGNLLTDLPPASFAMVMATGIVSIACHLLGFWFFAVPLFWLNVIFFLVLWVFLILRLILFRLLPSAAPSRPCHY